MTTADLLAAPYGKKDAPWSTWERGKPMSALGLAALLRRYKIRPKQFRSGDATPRGYERQQFNEAFEAHLPKNPKHPKQAGIGICIGPWELEAWVGDRQGWLGTIAGNRPNRLGGDGPLERAGGVVTWGTPERVGAASGRAPSGGP